MEGAPAPGWADAFVAAWAREFPLAPPVGHELWPRYPERWFRIHSLPASKRWPSTAAEYAEVLRRHNAVCDALFAPSEPVVLVVPAWGGAAGPWAPPLPAPGGPPAAPSPFPRALTPIGRIDPRELHPRANPDDDPFIYLAAAPLAWRRGAADAMMRYVADDRGRFLLAAEGADRVYAPYDGGADVFLPVWDDPDAWRTRFADWLSADPSGL